MIQMSKNLRERNVKTNHENLSRNYWLVNRQHNVVIYVSESVVMTI